MRITQSIAALALVLVAGGMSGLHQPARAQDDTSELVAGNTAFAFDLFQAVHNDGKNTLLSPYSISAALAMVYGGARGETAQQMADTLHFALPAEDVHPAFAALDASLTPPDDAGDAPGDPFQLSIANALWGQEGYPFLEAFVALLAEYYEAGLYEVDFATATEQARQTINQWVSDETEGRIEDLIERGLLAPSVRMVLTNAIYFNASWQTAFEPGDTQDGPFTLLDGAQVTVPMMHQFNTLPYASGPGYQAIALPYVGDRVAMVILLPDAGEYAAFVDGLDAAQFRAILDSLQHEMLALSMPRWEYEAEFQLGQTLAALGMPALFEPNADLSGISAQNDLFIGDVIHKAFVRVDEAGTEAAAATAIIAPTGGPASPVEVTVDRPFLYAIYDQETGAVLFLGNVVNPAG